MRRRARAARRKASGTRAALRRGESGGAAHVASSYIIAQRGALRRPEPSRSGAGALDIQQQVLALPGADHLQEHLVLGFLDDGKRLDERLAQELHQRVAGPQLAQRLIERARQPEGQVVGTADDRITTAAGPPSCRGSRRRARPRWRYRDWRRRPRRGSRRGAPAHRTSARAGPPCGCRNPSAH